MPGFVPLITDLGFRAGPSRISGNEQTFVPDTNGAKKHNCADKQFQNNLN